MYLGMTAENSQSNGGEPPKSRQIMNHVLWIVQVLLSLIFLFAGGIKLVLPLETMTEQMSLPLPGLYLRFLGVAEVLSAIGLILPGLLGIRPGLTPLAAAGLVIIMIGATVITLAGGALAPALVPLVVGLLSALVAYGRRPWSKAPAGTIRRSRAPSTSDTTSRTRS
ncbi:MAG TPA: DoxX family protein [Chloroflexia bacterium]|nr:DoxX family protein [Chloroflexia bacterium]